MLVKGIQMDIEAGKPITIAQVIKKLQDLAEASEFGLESYVYMQVEGRTFHTPKFELEKNSPLKTHVKILPEFSEEYDETCERCGNPCEGNSDPCFCEQCWERTLEIENLRDDIVDAIDSVTQERIRKKR